MVKLLYTAEEAAEALKLSRTAVFNLIKLGELDSVKIGHRRRIPIEALNAYVARLAEATAGPVDSVA